MTALFYAAKAGQDASFGAGLAASIPVGIYETGEGLVELALHPLDSFKAIATLIEEGNFTEAMKQSYLNRINKMKAEYEKAGADGSFKAGLEVGQLLQETVGVLAGGAGAAKVGTKLTKVMAETGKVVVNKGGKAAEKIITDLPNLQTGKVINPHIDLNDLSKSLPKGYEYISASEVKGPKGGIYHLIGRDADGNPVYFNNNKFVSFEDGLKKELKSDSGLVRTSAMDDYGTKYKWLLDEKVKNINEKPGFSGEVKQHYKNDYFKFETEWQAPQNGTGLKYKVYQQEIDPNLRPNKDIGDNRTNLELMKRGYAPYILRGVSLKKLRFIIRSKMVEGLCLKQLKVHIKAITVQMAIMRYIHMETNLILIIL